MHNFLENSCPYCGKKFTAEDDIVVCPECGTPHHRECYKEHGVCFNEDKHSETFEWKDAYLASVTTPAPKFIHSENETLLCPNCKTENPSDGHYCLKCGSVLSNEDMPKLSPEEEFQQERERAVLKTLEENIGGISAKEALIFVKSNGRYFLPRFSAFSKGMKFDTNFSAFIFSFFYLFYRKMYGLGFAVMISTLLLNIPVFLLDLVTIQEQYIEVGMLSQIIWEIPNQEELAIFSIIANVLIFIMRFLLMIFFNRIYYHKVVKTVKEARSKLANSKEDEIVGFFRKKGGTSLLLPLLCVAAAFALSFIFTLIIVSSEFFIIPDISNFI